MGGGGATFAVASAPLTWADCSIEADFPHLTLTAYSHAPDPIVATQANNISRTFLYAGFEPLVNLTETVRIDTSPVSPTDPFFEGWLPYFKNGPFDVCGARHDGLCPVEPGDHLEYTDFHSPSVKITGATWFRAQERYFGNSGEWIGCNVVVYEQVAALLRS